MIALVRRGMTIPSRCGACVWVLALACGAPAGDSEGASTEGSESGDGGGSKSGTGGQLPDPEPEPCGTNIQLEATLPNLIMVVDRSATTVAGTWDHDGDPDSPEVTAWWSTRTVIEEIFELGADDNDCGQIFKPGLVVSPSAQAQPIPMSGACSTAGSYEVEPWVLTQAAILDALPDASAQNLAGGSPLAAAYEIAVDALVKADEGVGSYVMLIVHAPPTCAVDAADPNARFEQLDPRLLELVDDAFVEHQIGTFVVGVDIDDAPYPAKEDGLADGVSPWQYLNELAWAGGHPNQDSPDQNFYTPDDAAFLSFLELAGEAGTCLVPVDGVVDPAPLDADEIQVVVDGHPVPNLEESECWGDQSGWYYEFPGYALSLCGPACRGLDKTCYLEPPHMRMEVDVIWDCQ